MAELFNQDTVPAESLPGGARRQRLLDGSRVSGTRYRFDRLTLDAGDSLDLQVPDSGIIWAQLVTGSAELAHVDDMRSLSELDALFLPPRFAGTLTSGDGAELIAITLPEAEQLDPSLAHIGPEPQFINLSEEPLLESEHDERLRIYVASQKLFGTTALAGEIVIFPPDTTSSNHHHVGAEHFQYVLRGSGYVFLNEEPHRMRAGDLVYKYDGERHYCQSDGDGKLEFVEFFAPGEWETVWADPDLKCTWSPTGLNLEGGAPSREIAAHTSDGTVYEDV